jgi:hypothetical protein
VNYNGVLDTARSKNVVGSSLYEISGTDYYCLDLAPGITGSNVTVTPGTLAPRLVQATFGDPFTSCGSGGQVPGDVTATVEDAAGNAAESELWFVIN